MSNKTSGFPDWPTWQTALDKHLATIPPEQHDMERQEWERWQRRHMLAKSTPDGDNRLMQLTADLVGTSRQRLKAKRHGSTAEYEAAKAVHEAAYTTLKEALAKSAREASAKVTK